ncbi:MAG: ABC transporter substrate-binding protein [Deltaproteobacteria bacterium]|nr:ABC transporter substrate-binding protein [Deltaproteobacteria bacterium]
MNHLRLILFRAGYNLPVFAAEAVGIFARRGITLAIDYTPSSRATGQGLIDGTWQLGHTAADDLIEDNVERGADLFMFMGLHSGFLRLIARSSLRAVGDLRGQRLAVDSATSGFVLVLRKILALSGLGPGEYELVPVGAWERRFEALMAGGVAATLLSAPWDLKAQAQGCRCLARAEEFVPHYQATGGATTRRWARANRDCLVRYIAAYVDGVRWILDPGNRDAALRVLIERGGVEPEFAAATFDVLIDPATGLYLDAGLNLPGWEAAIALRHEMGLLSPPLPGPDQFCDPSYHAEALALLDAGARR